MVQDVGSKFPARAVRQLGRLGANFLLDSALGWSEVIGHKWLGMIGVVCKMVILALLESFAILFYCIIHALSVYGQAPQKY